jgi:hypothetical protein
MKKIFLFISLFISAFGVFSQGVGIDDAVPDAMLDVRNTQAGASFRVDDDGIDGDATPFIILKTGGVGIGTPTPDASSLLDMTATGLGFLVPRMIDASKPATPVTGLLFYQTDAGSDQAGFHYYDGAVWRPLSGWDLTGNGGTVAGINFIGTTDGVALDFRTNNTIRMQLTNGNQLLTNDGTAALPFFSFISDPNTGIFRSGADELRFSTAGVEKFSMTSTEAVFNDPSNDYDFRVESNASTHGLFVDAGNNRVGINTTTGATTVPQRELDVRGTIIGALPCVSIAIVGEDNESSDNDVMGFIVASVPSTNRIWVKSIQNAGNTSTDELQDEADWTNGVGGAWKDFGDPSGGAAGYIMDISTSIVFGGDRDENDFGAVITVRWSDGTIYIRSTDANTIDDDDIDDTVNWGATWSSWTGPGM